MTDTKVCRRCGVEKPRADYYPNRVNADGLQGYCKPCMRAADRVPPRELPPIRCGWQRCSRLFTPAAMNSKYCGEPCKRQAANALKRQRDQRTDGKPKWSRSAVGDVMSGVQRHVPRPFTHMVDPKWATILPEAKREFEALLAADAGKPGRPKKGAAHHLNRARRQDMEDAA